MTLIFHHYESSPFSELVRIAFGLKKASWQSVLIPNMGAKPDLAPLTGGYRKTPVLQIGADIYCDSAAIIDVIEATISQPTLFPAPLGQLARVIAGWAGGPMFFPAVATAFGPIADRVPQAFWDDRKALFGMDKARMLAAAPHLQTQLVAGLEWINTTLADGRNALGGDAFGYGDAAFYMDVWFAVSTGDPAAKAMVATLPHLQAWVDRVAAIGHGQRHEISAADALAAAAAATPQVEPQIAPGSGFSVGQMVTVRTEDPGANPVAGALMRLSNREIVLIREDPQVGTVAVHFPRMGQVLMPV